MSRFRAGAAQLVERTITVTLIIPDWTSLDCIQTRRGEGAAMPRCAVVAHCIVGDEVADLA